MWAQHAGVASAVMSEVAALCADAMSALSKSLGTQGLWHDIADDVPVIVVGGGAALCGDVLPGVSTVVRPEHADVANAVGAAIPQARP